MQATTSKESLVNNKYFVVSAKEDCVVLGNYQTGYHSVKPDEALSMGQRGLILGYINGKLVPCIHAGKQFNAQYYFCEGKLYRYTDSGYVTVNPRLSGECYFYNVGNVYVVARNGKYSCTASVLMNKKYNILDVSSIKLDDGRLFIHVQGIKNYCYNTVQAIFNELYFVNDYLLEEVYVTDDSKFDQISSKYREVPSNSTSIVDIKQRIVNSQIKTELERFHLAKIGNVLVLGGLEIDLGGNNEIQ